MTSNKSVICVTHFNTKSVVLNYHLNNRVKKTQDFPVTYKYIYIIYLRLLKENKYEDLYIQGFSL